MTKKTYSPAEIEYLKKVASQTSKSSSPLDKKQYSSEEIEQLKKIAATNTSHQQTGDYLRQLGRGVRSLASLPGDFIDAPLGLANLAFAADKKIGDIIYDKGLKNIPIVGEYLPQRTERQAYQFPSVGEGIRKGIDYYTDNYFSPQNESEKKADRIISEAGSLFVPGMAAPKIGSSLPKVGRLIESFSLAPTKSNIAGVAGGMGAREKYLEDNSDHNIVGELLSYGAGSVLGKGFNKAFIRPPSETFAAAKNASQKLKHPIESVKTSELVRYAKDKTDDFLARRYAKMYGFDETKQKVYEDAGIPYSLSDVAKEQQPLYAIQEGDSKRWYDKSATRPHEENKESAIKKLFLEDENRATPENLSDNAALLAAKDAKEEYSKVYKKIRKPAESVLEEIEKEGVDITPIFEEFGKTEIDPLIEGYEKGAAKSYQDSVKKTSAGESYFRLQNVAGKRKVKLEGEENLANEVLSVMENYEPSVAKVILDQFKKMYGAEKIETAVDFVNKNNKRVGLKNLEYEKAKIADAVQRHVGTDFERAQAKKLGKQISEIINEAIKSKSPEAYKAIQKANRMWSEFHNKVFDDGSIKSLSKQKGAADFLNDIIYGSKESIDQVISTPQVWGSLIFGAKSKEQKAKLKEVYKDIINNFAYHNGDFSMNQLVTKLNKLGMKEKKHLFKMGGLDETQTNNILRLVNLTKQNEKIRRNVRNPSGSGHMVEGVLENFDKMKKFSKGVKSISQGNLAEAGRLLVEYTFRSMMPNIRAKKIVSPAFIKKVEMYSHALQNPKFKKEEQFNLLKNVLNDKTWQTIKPPLIVIRPGMEKNDKIQKEDKIKG